MSKKECNAVFLFIAELTGSFVPGSGNEDTKIKCGQTDYINNNLHDLDLDNEEDRKEVHENVWLERLYNELDEYFILTSTKGSVLGDRKILRWLFIDQEKYSTETYKWTVPIELDASSSMCQYIGCLTGDKRLLEMTNVMGDTLEDPWKVKGMSRMMLKKAMTPILYGSSQACHELWQDNNIPYTTDDIKHYNEELANGAFGLANLFKEFIINNAKPKANMRVKIWNEEFDISCNRYRNVGEKTKAYKIWDSIDKLYNTVLHTDTKKIPDLEQFRRYFVTLLIHNLDAQVADNVIGKCMAKYGWGIPIHDAFLVSPAAAVDVRRWYAEQLSAIYNNRKQILKDYFESIGITGAANSQWEDLASRVVPLDYKLVVNHMCLK
jgi:hypothetical protein